MYPAPDTLRTISSRWTFFTKFIGPAFTVVIGIRFVLFAFEAIRNEPQLSVFVGFIVVTAMCLSLWNSFRIKKVKVDSNNLYVSNYLRDTVISLDHIAEVKANIWLEPQIVTIYLNSPSEFGEKISFLAPYRFFVFYTPSPIVDELRQLAARRQRNS